MKFQTVKDKDNSPDWERIKSFVGGANKASKHPLQQEMERAKMREPEHMSDGGEAGGFAIGGSGSDTLKMGGRLPLQIDPRGTISPPQMPLNPSIPPTMPPMAPNPALPAPMPVTPPPVAPVTAGGPMDASTDDQATKVMGGITPETIQRLSDALNNQTRKGQIGAGIAGIGDAIASVGGIKGEHMKNVEDFLQKNREEGMKIPGQMAALGKEKYSLSKELGGDEPTSRRSFVAQQANLPPLTKMGFKPEEIKAMPATLIDGIRNGAITREDAIARIKEEASFKNASLGLQKEQIEATKNHQGAEERLAKENQELAHPIMSGIKKFFGGQDEAFDHSAIAPGTVYKAPDGTTRKKQ